MIRFPLTVLLSLVLATSAFAQETQKPEAEKPVRDDFLSKHPTLVKMWRHSNEVRARYGLPTQQINAELTKAAQDHAWYMAKTGQFSHQVNGGFVSRTYRHGYGGSPHGEIILMGASSIPETFQGWLNSPGHRAILLSGAREVGYGYAISRNGTAYWVGVFGN